MGDQMTGGNELATMIGNIDALLNEIKQALGMNQQSTEMAKTDDKDQDEQIMQKNEDADADDVGGDKDPNEMKKSKFKKAVVETASDGTTANDDADERQEEEATDTSEENMDKLAKAFTALLTNKSINKSKKINPNAKIEKSLADIANLMKSMVDEQNVLKSRQSDIETAIMNVLKGLHIAGEIEAEVKKSEIKREPKGYTNSADNASMQTLIKSLVGATQEKQTTGFTAQDRNNDVMKSLRDPNMLNYLIGNPKQ